MEDSERDSFVRRVIARIPHHKMGIEPVEDIYFEAMKKVVLTVIGEGLREDEDRAVGFCRNVITRVRDTHERFLDVNPKYRTLLQDEKSK